jgi:antitoxin ParD1/3/4
MTKPQTLNVRVTGPLSEFVATNVGVDGPYENVSEYVRDLIRKDMERAEAQAFDRLKAELQRAFAAPDGSFRTVTAKDVLTRNKSR